MSSMRVFLRRGNTPRKGFITVFLAVTSLAVTLSGSVSLAGASTSSVSKLQAAVKAGTKLTSLPSTTSPSLAGDVWVKEIGGPMIPNGCISNRQSQSSVPICPLGDTASNKTMVLLGDSEAHMWAAAFVAIADARHERLVILAKDNCPPWLTTFLTASLSPFPQCTAFHSFALAEIRKLHPSQVYVTGAIGVLGDTSVDLKPSTLLLKDLRKEVPSTTVLSNVPEPLVNPVTCLSAHSSNISGCDFSYRLFSKQESQYRKTLKQAAKASGAYFANLDSLFCTRVSCPVVVADRLVYIDDDHITWQYAAYAADALNEVLAPTFKS